jgi:hypothetical protein
MSLDDLARIVDDAGPLRAVGYFFDASRPTDITAVRLMFVSGDFVVGIDEDDASVTLTSTTDELFTRWKLFDASHTPPWSAALGKTALWARLVEDQYGAPDGIQFEFIGVPGESASDDTVNVQLMTSDIALSVQTLTTLPTPYLSA